MGGLKMSELLKVGSRNYDGLAKPFVSDRDSILSVTNSNRYIPRRSDLYAENLILARKELKEKYIASRYSLLASQEDITYWDTGSSSTNSFRWDNNVNAAMLKLTATSAVHHQRTFSTPVDFSEYSHVAVMVDFDSISDFSTVTFRFYSSDSDYFFWTFAADASQIFGKGELTLSKASFRKNGTPTWTNITKIILRTQCTVASSNNTFYFRDFYFVKQKPKNAKILFRLDDGLLSVYENAMPIFRKYNIPASCFINPGFVDSVEHLPHTSYGGNPAMNLDEIKKLHSMGWSICSHTWYHNLYQDPTISEQSETILLRNKYSQAYHDLSAVQDWLYDNGFADGAQCSVYGNHYYNKETLQAERDLMLLGFSVHSSQSMFDTLPWGDGIRHLPSYYFFQHNTVDNSEVFPYVDDAITHGGLTVVMCHRFDTDAPDDILPNRPDSVSQQGSITPETLEACLKYICNKDGVDCITATDLAFATPAALY